MSKAYIITATGTDVGKTLTAAILMHGLNADYWKPIQCGLGGGEDTDTNALRHLTKLPAARFHREAYAFKMPASPHIASHMEGIVIDPALIMPPQTSRTLLIEGAGGLMVPITRTMLIIDVFKQLGAPIILCARTELGTINHTLLSVEGLHRRSIPLHGIVFLGADNKETMNIIMEFTQRMFPECKTLGHIPMLELSLHGNFEHLFHAHFHKRDFV